MLTAMPHKHRVVRRAHLHALGLTYPLLTTEMAKGELLDLPRCFGIVAHMECS
jgi:hypothetical protein